MHIRPAAAVLAATLLAAPMARAQDVATKPADPAAASQPATTSNPVAATTEKTTSSTTSAPQLTTATVKLTGGWRASKLIGAAVYDDQNQKVGTVDDLIMAGTDKIGMAVLSVGGFIGIGSKLVVVPYDKLRYDPSAENAKVVMPGASKDTLNAMPAFTYNG